jgi:hypothetical protein
VRFAASESAVALKDEDSSPLELRRSSYAGKCRVRIACTIRRGFLTSHGVGAWRKVPAYTREGRLLYTEKQGKDHFLKR